MDVDRIVREMDVKTLQDNIMHVTFSNIEAELVSVFMDGIIKKLACTMYYSNILCFFVLLKPVAHIR